MFYETVNIHMQHTAGCCGEAHHALVALALTESSLVETIPSLLHGVGGNLTQGVHNVILLVSGLWVLQNSKLVLYTVKTWNPVAADFKRGLPSALEGLACISIQQHNM
jgi:hypothetical protein